MKQLNYLLLFILAIISFGCEDKDNKSIQCEIYCKVSAETLSEGEHLYVSDLKIKPISPSTGVNVQKVEFYLGNRKIESCLLPPYELDYVIPDLPEGNHLFQIDVHLEAEGYNKTIVWIKQMIKIVKPNPTE